METKNILVTGGAGFIGTNLVEKLCKKGHFVKVIDNLSVSNINLGCLKELGVEIFEKDIGDFREIESLFKGIDTVYHLAAMNRAQRSIENPLLANKSNITGTLNVLESSRKAGVEKFVNISSSSVYAGVRNRPLKETDLLFPPHPYGVGKLCGEHYARLYYTIYGLKTVTLRYFSVYGPRQLGGIEKAGVVAKFIHRILKGIPIEIYGNGEQKRNFTFVDDVVDYTIKAAEAKEAVGEIFNIANENEITVNQVAEIIQKVSKKDARIFYTKSLIGDPARNPADITKAKSLLKIEPKWDFEKGIEKTIEWHKAKV